MPPLGCRGGGWALARWKLKRVKGHIYLVRVGDDGREESVGNVEVIYEVMMFLRARGARPQALEWLLGELRRCRRGLGGAGWASRQEKAVRASRRHEGFPGPEPIRPGETEGWMRWCLYRAGEKTCRGYLGYLSRPLEPGNSWSVRAYRSLLSWRCRERGEWEACRLLESGRLRLPASEPDVRVPGRGEVVLSLAKACRADPRLCQAYRLLVESGARLVEVSAAVSRYDPSRDVMVESGGRVFYEYQLGAARGRKRAVNLYHASRIDPRLSFTPGWATWMAGRLGVVRPKHVRKWVATRMLELEIPGEAVDFIQGRAPRSVLQRHYADLLALARRVYPRWLAEVEAVYSEAGLDIEA